MSKNLEMLADRLSPILLKVGEELIWRPIVDRRGRVVAHGAGALPDFAPETLDGVDFVGKRVLDLGCNFGYYAFHAARLGASSVLGVDVSPDIIEGCRILRDHYDLPNVEFRVADFIKEDLGGPFDVVLLVDFIGRGVVSKGKLDGVLATIERTVAPSGEALLSLHESYDAADLEAAEVRLDDLYPARFIAEGRFMLRDYVAWRLGEGWSHVSLPTRRSVENGLKTPLLFSRR